MSQQMRLAYQLGEKRRLKTQRDETARSIRNTRFVFRMSGMEEYAQWWRGRYLAWLDGREEEPEYLAG